MTPKKILIIIIITTIIIITITIIIINRVDGGGGDVCSYSVEDRWLTLKLAGVDVSEFSDKSSRVLCLCGFGDGDDIRSAGVHELLLEKEIRIKVSEILV